MTHVCIIHQVGVAKGDGVLLLISTRLEVNIVGCFEYGEVNAA